MDPPPPILGGVQWTREVDILSKKSTLLFLKVEKKFEFPPPPPSPPYKNTL